MSANERSTDRPRPVPSPISPHFDAFERFTWRLSIQSTIAYVAMLIVVVYMNVSVQRQIEGIGPQLAKSRETIARIENDLATIEKNLGGLVHHAAAVNNSAENIRQLGTDAAVLTSEDGPLKNLTEKVNATTKLIDNVTGADDKASKQLDTLHGLRESVKNAQKQLSDLKNALDPEDKTLNLTISIEKSNSALGRLEAALEPLDKINPEVNGQRMGKLHDALSSLKILQSVLGGLQATIVPLYQEQPDGKAPKGLLIESVATLTTIHNHLTPLTAGQWPKDVNLPDMLRDIQKCASHCASGATLAVPKDVNEEKEKKDGSGENDSSKIKDEEQEKKVGSGENDSSRMKNDLNGVTAEGPNNTSTSSSGG